MSISRVHARQIYDSRGTPTIEVEVTTPKGIFRSAVPSGASTGKHEALELRDEDPKHYHGKGVSKAVGFVNNEIASALIKSGLQVTQQFEIDDFLISLDGTANKSKFGANAILGVSMAVARAGAAHKGLPLYKHIADLAGNKEPSLLPVPFFNVLNGGSHAGNKLAMQEFMVAPVGASNFAEAMKIGSEIYKTLGSVIKSKFGIDATNVGAEGGFAPSVASADEALDLIMEAINKSGHKDKVKIALDVAASEFLVDDKYDLNFKCPENEKKNLVTAQELRDIYMKYIKEYPIISIEDPFAEEMFDSHADFCAKVNVQVVGDDLLVTNPVRITKAVEMKAVNALLLKLNQIGTLKESIESFKIASTASWGVMVSHRSGETEDTFIADLVIGLGSGQIKTGAPCRSERLAKYNQLLRIEEELGSAASYGLKSPIFAANANIKGTWN